MRSIFLTLAAAAAFVASASASEPVQVELLVPEQLEHVVAMGVKSDTEAAGINNLGHYGHPPDDCDKDEVAVQISGIPGAICTAKCTDFLPCPKDVPDGVTAQPTCALQDRSGNHYCVLLCKPGQEDGNLRHSGDDGCGEATCQPIQGMGICTYAA